MPEKENSATGLVVSKTPLSALWYTLLVLLGPSWKNNTMQLHTETVDKVEAKNCLIRLLIICMSLNHIAHCAN